MLDYINYSDYSFNNLEITNDLIKDDFNPMLDFKDILYVNNIINTDLNNNYNLDLNQSNNLFIIDTNINPNYKNEIIEIKKDKTFYSNNHNLKYLI